MLAAKEEHKRMLKKQRCKWYELLNEDSDSDGEVYNENFDELNSNIRNLNFNSNTNNYYSGLDKASSHLRPTDMFQLHKSVSKRERNQLKTNNLRQSISKMMTQTPSQSRIWNVEPFSDNIPKLNIK